MALSKQKILNTGLSGSYWKITNLSVDIQKMTAYFTLSLFAGKFSRHMQPLELSKNFSMPVTKEDLTEDLRAKAYAYIKDQNDPDLENATNV